MKKVKLISTLISFFVVAPIWYYLIYQLLKRVDASELMFFLFWVYMPAAIFAAILSRIAEAAAD